MCEADSSTSDQSTLDKFDQKGVNKMSDGTTEVVVEFGLLRRRSRQKQEILITNYVILSSGKSVDITGKTNKEKPVNGHKFPAFVVAMKNIIRYENETCWLVLPLQMSISCTNQLFLKLRKFLEKIRTVFREIDPQLQIDYTSNHWRNIFKNISRQHYCS